MFTVRNSLIAALVASSLFAAFMGNAQAAHAVGGANRIVTYSNMEDLHISFAMPAKWGQILQTAKSFQTGNVSDGKKAQAGGAYYLIATTPAPFVAEFVTADYFDQYHAPEANVFSYADGVAALCKEPGKIMTVPEKWNTMGTLLWTCDRIVLDQFPKSYSTMALFEFAQSPGSENYYFIARTFGPYTGPYFEGQTAGVVFSYMPEYLNKKFMKYNPVLQESETMHAQKYTQALKSAQAVFVDTKPLIERRFGMIPSRDRVNVKHFWRVLTTYRIFK